jgi:formate-dependent nitrite reductase membrane component NrfD
MHVWGWEIPVYLFLGGVVAGIMIFAGLRFLRRGDENVSVSLSLMPWVAPIAISLGMFFLWLDLEHPFNAWRFYLTFKLSSPMSWGAWILLGVYPVSILLAWVASPEGLKAKVREKVGRFPLFGRIDQWAGAKVTLLARLNIILGASLGIYTGVLLGTMAARPLWNSALLGPLFLVSGLSTGAAFMLLFRLSDKERKTLGRADMALIVIELVLLGLWMVGLATAGSASRGALYVILGGPYTAAFWTLVVALGLLAPLVGEWLEFKHGAVPGRGTAVLVLLGGFALRWILVFAGQASGWVTEIAMR